MQRVVRGLGEVSEVTTKSQVAFRRRRGFAYLWRPGQYVSNDVPLVVAVALPRELRSDRVKQVVHPSTGVWMHHVELGDAAEVDQEIAGWLAEAYAAAG